jgi:hypothetical protein
VCRSRKLEKKLQLEKKQADNLMSKIMTADKPKFGKAAKAAAARSPHGAAEPSHEGSENSIAPRNSPSLIPHVKNGATTPSKPSYRHDPPLAVQHVTSCLWITVAQVCAVLDDMHYSY